MFSHKNRLMEAIQMSTHNIPFSLSKENHPSLSKICYDFKNEFETAVVEERSVVEPLKVYCIVKYF